MPTKPGWGADWHPPYEAPKGIVTVPTTQQTPAQTEKPADDPQANSKDKPAGWRRPELDD